MKKIKISEVPNDVLKFCHLSSALDKISVEFETFYDMHIENKKSGLIFSVHGDDDLLKYIVTVLEDKFISVDISFSDEILELNARSEERTKK